MFSKSSLVLPFNDGKVPRIPFLHDYITSFVPETKNMGDTITGIDKRDFNSESVIVVILFLVKIVNLISWGR
jgi:hypothetical protein